MTAKNVKQQLDSTGFNRVSVRINSPGGDVFEGVAICNLLKACGKPVDVFIDGVAASSASIIAMAGSTISIANNALLMIHNAWSVAIGEAKDMRKMADTLDTVTASIAATSLVATMAALSHGTGKYQQIADVTSQGLIANSSAAGLLEAQKALAAYKVAPTSFDLDTYRPGLFPGMTLPVAFTTLVDVDSRLNGNWIIEEINASLIPAVPYLGTFGHYRYTVKMVDIQEVGSYLPSLAVQRRTPEQAT